MMAILKTADIFYMCGVHSGVEPPACKLQHMQPAMLIAKLRVLVQSNEIAYIGICGGAKLAGRATDYVHTSFDLLAGTYVHYDSNVNAKMVDLQTNVVNDVVQFTTGCAIALMLTPHIYSAICFPTVKNRAQWFEFVAMNTLALQPFLNFKADIIEQPVASVEQPELAKNSIAKTPANCVATPPTEVSPAEKSSACSEANVNDCVTSER